MAEPEQPALRAAFRQPFREQIDAFRLRLGTLVPTARWDDIWKAQHDRAFMVAGAAKADLLADLAAAVDRAVTDGVPFDQFRTEFLDIADRHGWRGWTGDESDRRRTWRAMTIYRTNLRTSYMAGRHAQLVEGGFRYWVYRHGGSAEPRVQHLGWDGLILPPDHPFWATHFPPNGWGCSCYVIGARSMRSAVRRGGKPELTLPDNWADIDPATGEPRGLDRGWGYAPGATVTDDVLRLSAASQQGLPAILAEAVEALTRRIAQGDGPDAPDPWWRS